MTQAAVCVLTRKSVLEEGVSFCDLSTDRGYLMTQGNYGWGYPVTEAGCRHVWRGGEVVRELTVGYFSRVPNEIGACLTLALSITLTYCISHLIERLTLQAQDQRWEIWDTYLREASTSFLSLLFPIILEPEEQAPACATASFSLTSMS